MKKDTILLFDDYLQDSLSPEDKQAFEKKLAENNLFREQFNTYKEISGYLEHKFSPERTTLEKTLKQTGNKYFGDSTQKEKSKIFKLSPWQYSIAASVMLLIGFYFLNLNSKLSYADYAFSEKINLVERNTPNELLKNAEKAFNSKNYEQAIVYFDSILKRNTDNSEIQFYKSIALIETNHFSEADSLLSKLSLSTSVFKDKALFYKALSKLKQKDKQASKTLLKQVSKNAEEYEKAQEILKKLK